MLAEKYQRPLVWALAVMAYVLAIINRSSFTALGASAQEHFSAEATIVSVFIVVQLVLYAGSQIPVGIYLDRTGPSAVMLTGLTLMGIGQLAMALTQVVPIAILARVLVGAGDACMFVSLIRIISDWFQPRQIPTTNQVSSLIGYGGQLLAVAPLAAAVGAVGWTTTFTTLALLTLLLATAIAFFLKDTPVTATLAHRLLSRRSQPEKTATGTIEVVPEHSTETSPITAALPVTGPGASGVLPALKSLLKRPGIRLAFWVHFTTCFATNAFVLLWGVPFMTGGLGYTPETARQLMNLLIVAVMASGLIAGPVFSRFARYRVHIVFIEATINLSIWCVILLWDGAAPVWLMVICVLLLGAGGPSSMVAFEVVRSHAPHTQRGIGTGMANMGGFFAALVAVLLIGMVLDALGAGTPETYSLAPFKWAMAVQVPLFVLGLTMIIVEAPQAKRYLMGKGLR